MEQPAGRAARRRSTALTDAGGASGTTPSYITHQAKSRSACVLPGEMPLIVLSDPDGAARDAGRPPPAGDAAEPDPWYGTLWSSIQAANAAGAR